MDAAAPSDREPGPQRWQRRLARLDWRLVVFVAWAVRYLTMEGPDIGHPTWAGWFDQNLYLRSTQALAVGNLSIGRHWYPLGYPLLAAPFAVLLPANPFLPLDAILFVATAAAFRRVAARMGIGSWPAAGIFVATTLIQAGLASAWVRPWTTTLSATMIWWLAEATLATGDAAPPGRGRLVAIGMLAGGLPLVRPLDALIAAICLLVVAATLARQGRMTLRAAAAVVAGGIAVVAGYLLLHLAIYGARPSEYMTGSARVGFVLGDLGFKAYVLLVDARAWFPDSDTVLQRLPWVVPGAAGLIAAAVSGRGRGRRVPLLLLALIVPSSAIMLTFADLVPPGLWRFGNIHYFKWTMPAFGLGLAIAWRRVRDGDGRWGVVAATAALAALVLLVRIDPVPIAGETPARMLFFHGRTDRSWEEAFFTPVRLADSAGALHSPGEFHQLPDPGGARAVAIVRPFAQHPRRFDPQDPGADPRPYARFDERIAFGWPFR